MSETAHRVPGQSILERLYGRGTVRPQIGASTSFYERLGLTDPWLDGPTWSADADADDSFFFLSAAPYYARLRSQRQREWRARRRLLLRLSDPARRGGGMLGTLGMARQGMAASWLSQKTRTSHLAWASVSDMRVLEAAPVQEQAVEQKPRFYTSNRPLAPQVVYVDRPAEGPAAVARVRAETPIARAMRQPGRVVGEVSRALDDVASTLTGSKARRLRRLVEEVGELPPEEQIVAARHITRQFRGPSARVARVAIDEAAEDGKTRPLAVATRRDAPVGVKRKGLRTVLSSSPLMQTLAFEEAVAAEATKLPLRRVSPAPQAAPATRREPMAPVARDVRTQRAAVRAGPTAEAPAADLPSSRRRPTARVATMAGSSRRLADETDVRFGLDALGTPKRRLVGLARVAARKQDRGGVDSRGVALVTPSATSSLRRAPVAAPQVGSAPTERAIARAEAPRRLAGRRRGLVLAPPTSYVEPIQVAEQVREPAPTRRVTAPTERAIARSQQPRRTDSRGSAVLSPAPVAHVVERAPDVPRARRVVSLASTLAPLAERGERRVQRAPEQPGERPLRTLADRGEAPARAGRTRRAFVSPVSQVLLEPSEPTQAPVATPTARAAARLRPVDAPAPKRRVSLAVPPTAYLDDVVEPVQPRGAEAAPARATQRASARAEQPSRTDSRGRGLLTRAPTDYLQLAEQSDKGLLSRSPVAAEPRARRVPTREVAESAVASEPGRLVAPQVPAEPRVRRMRGAQADTSTVLRPIEPEQAVAEPVGRPSPTARVAQRAQAPASKPAKMLVRDPAPMSAKPRRVRSGSAAYASARVADAGRAAPVTPLTRQTRHRRSALPHVVASHDFNLLLPETAPQPEVRVQRRFQGPAPVSRARLADILDRVTTLARAEQRSDDSRTVLPGTQRSLEGVSKITRRTLSTAGGQGIVLRVVLEDEPQVTQVERAERRGAIPTEQRGSKPSGRPIARAFAGSDGVQTGVDHIVSRGTDAPRSRRTSARTLRTADGQAILAHAPVAEVRSFGLGAPGLPAALRLTEQPARRGRPAARRLPAVDATGAVLARAEGDTPQRTQSRPLGRTLGYVQDSEQPVRERRAAPEARRARGSYVATDALARPAQAIEDEAPAWAQRAVRGTAARRRRPGSPELLEEQVRGEGAGFDPNHDLISALARARRPQDVVQVIMERGKGLRNAAKVLPGPAVRLVERIVRAEAEAQVIQATTADEGSTLDPHRRPNRSASGTTLRTLPQPGASGASVAAVRRAQGLADKLMKLIQTAEVERNRDEARRQVRMAEDTDSARSEGGAGAQPDKGGKSLNLKQFESDVLAAVLRELDMMQSRSAEDGFNVWNV